MSNVKDIFVSRFDDGCIVDVDFSGVEIYVAANLSKDPTLMQELASGVDIHTENAFVAYKPKDNIITKTQRSNAKALTFQLLYGAGAASMAKKFNLTVKFCSAFIKKFYAKYSILKQWHTSLEQLVNASRKPSAHKTELGYPAGIGELRSFSGRLFKFIEYDTSDRARKKNKYTSFSRPAICNYPVQGGAFDIMALALGIINRHCMQHRDKYLLINCVHDSFLFDCRNEYAQTLQNFIRGVEAQLSELCLSHYGYKVLIPFKLDIQLGPSWGAVK